MRARWRKRFIFIVLLLSFFIWVADLIRFSSTLFMYPGERYQDQAVDVIAVLTGGQKRFQEAFSFLQRDQGKMLFISGIDEGVSLEDVFKANKIVANPSDYNGRIFVDRVSKSTSENAVEIRKIVEWLSAKSVLVVTSSYHMRRAMTMIRRQIQKAPALNVQVYEWAVESPNFDRTNWWTSVTSWEIFLSEYFKTRIDDFYR